MQIVIDIPDGYVGVIMSNQRMKGSVMDKLIRQAIIDCTPLPKGHGRLVDADALNERMKQRHYENADEESYWVADVIETALNPNNGYAPTIIEADKAESEVQDADSD